LLGVLAAIATAGLLGVDYRVTGFVHDHEPAWLHALARKISLIGGIGLLPLAAAAALAWAWWIQPNRRVWHASVWLLAAEGVTAVVVRLLKILFGRVRPDRLDAGHFGFFDPTNSKNHSFPSGHTADAMAAAMVLWFACPRLRPLWAAWVVTMAAARICALQHFLADAAAGAALGFLCVLATRNWPRRLERRAGIQIS
jgi:membrane-associated phospholipid phosphatase